VVLVPYDGFTKPSTMKLFLICIWIQIHNIPVGFVGLPKSLACKVGEFIVAEGTSHDFCENFFHVRVKLDVRKTLKNDVCIVHERTRNIFPS
jgi:hypothetical protein